MASNLRSQLSIPESINNFSAMTSFHRFGTWTENMDELLSKSRWSSGEAQGDCLLEGVFVSRAIEAEDFFLKVAVHMSAGLIF